MEDDYIDAMTGTTQSSVPSATRFRRGREMDIFAVFQTVVGAALCIGSLVHLAGFQQALITVLGPLLAGSGGLLVASRYLPRLWKSRREGVIRVGFTLAGALFWGVFVTGEVIPLSGAFDIWAIALLGIGMAVLVWLRVDWTRLLQGGVGGVGTAVLALLALRFGDNMNSPGAMVLCYSFVAAVLAAFLGFRFLCYSASRLLFAEPDDVWLGPRPPATSESGLRMAVGLVAGCWLLLTISAPGICDKLNRQRQMATWRSIAVVVKSLEEFAIEHSYYPKTAPMEDLAKLVKPTFVAKLPTSDGWGWPLSYHKIGNVGIVVRSPGKDGLFEHDDATAYAVDLARDYERDLVWSTVSGSQWPAGIMGP